MPDKEKKPLGAPLPLTDEELDALAEVTADDIERARALVRRVAPELADILDAEPIDLGELE
jgi:hypothetical protein